MPNERANIQNACQDFLKKTIQGALTGVLASLQKRVVANVDDQACFVGFTRVITLRRTPVAMMVG